MGDPPPKRFYRTTVSDRKVAGVCGGVAHYLNVDPTLVRILWVVSIFLGAAGLIAYIVFWIAAPREEDVPGRAGPTHASLRP